MNVPASPTSSPVFAFVAAHKIRLGGALLVLAALLAYLNSFSVPFVYDDLHSIVENRSIRRLSALAEVLHAPPGTTPEGRPLLNASFAFNYAFGGTTVTGYHVLNLLIHALGGLVLFGLVRRALLLPRWRERFEPAAFPLALAIAGLWTLHPLQTESVTYVVQRAESLMGLFYLLTLYCFVRSAGDGSPFRWQVLSVAACLLGMASKEVMASAPLIVLLFDRAFVAGSFRDAVRSRLYYYCGLASTWLLLEFLVASTGGNRGGAVGYGVSTSLTAWWFTQFEAVARYLQLALWPHPLVFEYDTRWMQGAADVQPWAFYILPLVLFALVAAVRWPAWGFFGAMFLAILAPTSLVPGTTQMIVEHRMYLALAPLLALVVLAVHRWLGRRSWFVFAAAAVIFGVLTVIRNSDYATPLGLWNDTLAKRSNNATAHVQAAMIYYAQGQLPEAAAHLQEAVRIRPDLALAHHNLGQVLADAGRLPEAVQEFRTSIRLEPDSPISYASLGNTLVQAGRIPAGLAFIQIATRLEPKYAVAQLMLGLALYKAGRIPESLAVCEHAVSLNPDDPISRNYFANTLVAAGRLPDAQVQLEAALQLEPGNFSARFNLGRVLLARSRPSEARAQFTAALAVRPASPEAHFFLGESLAILGDAKAAVTQYTEAVRLRPDYPEARARLGLPAAPVPAKK